MYAFSVLMSTGLDFQFASPDYVYLNGENVLYRRVYVIACTMLVQNCQN